MAGSNYVPQNNQIKTNRTRPLSPQPLFSDPVARDRGHLLLHPRRVLAFFVAAQI